MHNIIIPIYCFKKQIIKFKVALIFKKKNNKQDLVSIKYCRVNSNKFKVPITNLAAMVK